MIGTRMAGLVALLAAGCGLNEYETLMRKTQDRVQRFDEENRLLGEPLVAPTVTDPKTKANVAVAEVFLRPPRGIADKVGQARLNDLYRYPATQVGGTFTALEVAFGKGEDDLAAKYKDWFPGVDAPALQKRDVAGRPFQVAEFDYNATDSAAVYITPAQKGRTQVALVYWLDRSKKAGAVATLNFSLSSLGVDTEAPVRRSAFYKRSPWGSAP
jgi:hypothetical protein